MADRPWKAEERQVARLLGGRRHPANTGGRVDVEGDRVVSQVKDVRRLSLARIKALVANVAAEGERRGKLGIVVLKRRAGRGQPTPRLILMVESMWAFLAGEREARRA